MPKGYKGKSIRRAAQVSTRRDIDIWARKVRLAEYKKLKDEVANRSTLQSAIVTLNIAAVGALGGVVIGHQANLLILLLLIPLSTALGLLWLDHAQTIARIGEYIRNRKLIPHLGEPKTESHEPESYEEVVAKTSALDVSTYLVPFFVIFIGPSIASVAATFHAIRGAEQWTFWSADVLITSYCFSIWVIFLRSTGRRREQASAEEGDRLGEAVARRRGGIYGHARLLRDSAARAGRRAALICRFAFKRGSTPSQRTGTMS
jgi:hypothetical protein